MNMTLRSIRALALAGVALTLATTGRAAITANALTANALTANALTANALTANALTANALTANALTANALTNNALTNNGLSAHAPATATAAPVGAYTPGLSWKLQGPRLDSNVGGGH